MPLPDQNLNPPPHPPAEATHHGAAPHPSQPAAHSTPAADSAAPLVVDEQQRRITVAAGQTFAIQKINSGSIGYSWDLADAGDVRVVELLGNADSRDTPRASGPPIVGAPSHITWTFRAVAAGHTELRFTFSQRIGLGMAVPGPEAYTVTVH